MVARKPLPHSYSPGGVGSDDIPDILRPGGGRNRPQSPGSTSNTNTNNSRQDYSSFTEEQSAWRQQGFPPQQPPQQRPPIPTILLQTATGSSTASAFSDTNPFKRKVLGNDMYSASPTAMSSMAYPTDAEPAELPSSPQGHHYQDQTQAQNGQPAQNPWQPSYDNSRTNSASPTPLPTIIDAAEDGAGHSESENAWASAHALASGGPPITRPPIPAGINAAPSSSTANFRNSNLISFPPDEEQDSADWSDVASPSQPSASSSTVVSAAPPRPPFTPLSGSKETAAYEDSHAWDDVGSKPAVNLTNVVPLVTDMEAAEGWNLVDTEPVPGQLSRQSTWENFSDDEDNANSKKDKTEKKGKSTDIGQAPPAATSAQNTSAQSSASQPPLPQLSALSLADGGKESANLTGINTNNTKAKGKAVDSAGVSPSSTTFEPLIALDSPSQFGDVFSPMPAASTSNTVHNDNRPQLPPRSMLDVDVNSVPPPAHPPRPVDSSKTETYPVKLVTWFDARIPKAKNPRVSPILVQNANGPCPLVALVNALTLTTPADTRSGLVEALATREQVSLDLLLSNVFDELMSRRSFGSDDDIANLPDIDDLYSFLKGLHTGMNVNPRYIPTPDVVTTFRRTSLTHLHPTEREEMIPGTFENTREMQLYATFSIPLIHGWLPAKPEPVYDALRRQAASYEDVQNLLFRQEELEEKLLRGTGGQGLSYDEELLYQDILEIKTFLNTSATQLTPFGLNVLAKAMIPGTFAILFRNDHFSTLYLHPDTMQLMQLVTDAGYATHDEVVWETLVDVNGEFTEYFSGDFRLVGGEAAAAASASGSTRRSQDGPSTETETTDETARHEQEDRDLALALQLQEEEEAHQREAEARRQSRLSEQYIEQNGRPSAAANTTGRRPSNNNNPYLPSPRRSSQSAQTSTTNIRPQTQVVRPLVPPATTTTATSTTQATRVNSRPAVHRAQDDGDAEAPPSYEHAAQQAAYHPPPGAPGSETATLAGTTSNASGTGRRPSPSVSTPNLNANARPQQPPRANMGYAQGQYVQPGRYGQPNVAGRGDRECVIM